MTGTYRLRVKQRSYSDSCAVATSGRRCQALLHGAPLCHHLVARLKAADRSAGDCDTGNRGDAGEGGTAASGSGKRGTGLAQCWQVILGNTAAVVLQYDAVSVVEVHCHLLR